MANFVGNITGLIRTTCSTTFDAPRRKVWWNMTDEQSLLPASRQRIQRLRVLVLPEEAETIKAYAANCALSVSTYLRRVGLAYQPKSVLDYRAVVELSKVNADQGRLGGLLKMWLSNDERFGVDDIALRNNLNRLLGDLMVNQQVLMETVKRV